MRLGANQVLLVSVGRPIEGGRVVCQEFMLNFQVLAK